MLPALLALALAAGPEPALVELYSSEGCSSCPAAEALLRERAARDESLVALEFHVDYWNSLGWADPFSSPAFSDRQSRDAAFAGTEQVYTPQAVVDGRARFVGSDRAALDGAIAAAHDDGKRPLAVSAEEGKLVVVGANVPGGELWVAVTESGLQTAVPRGENQGRVLRHAPVVRSFRELGSVPTGGWTRDVALALDSAWVRARLRVVAAVQDPRTGRILALGSARLPR